MWLKLCLLLYPILTVTSTNVANVLVLNDSGFHEYLEAHPKILVKFMVSWCQYCEELAPIYEALGEELFYNSSSIRLAEINCHDNKESCQLYDVAVYPSIVLYKNAIEFSRYEGAHTRVGLIEYLEQEFRKPYTNVDTLEDFENVKHTNRWLVVGYFTNTSTMRFLFEHYSDKLKVKYDFAVVDNSTLFGYEEEYLELFRPKYLRNQFETEPVILKNIKINSKIFEHFINIHKHGLVGVRNINNTHEFHPPLFVLFYDIDYELNAKKTMYYRNRLLKVAIKYPEYNFAISDYDLMKNDIDLDNINITMSVILIQVNEKFVMNNEFSIANIEEFLKQYKNGELIPHLRSQPIPEENSYLNVKVAVATNFNDLVYHNNKDTLLAFIREDCEYCRQLESMLEDLATLLAPENIDVIKIDVKYNDIPAIFVIEAYPTMVWLPRNDKTDLEYYLESDKSLKSLLAFIAERATVELTHYDRSGRIRKINKNFKEEL